MAGAFKRAANAIAAGLAAGESARAGLERFSASSQTYAAFQNRHQMLTFDPPLIEFIDVVSNRSRSPHLVPSQLSPLADKPLNVDA